jgi:hypothetical protein
MPPALALAAALAALAGCSPDTPAAPDLAPFAHEFGLDPTPADDPAAHLAWHAPAPCDQVYRVRVAETYPEGLAEFLHTKAEHSTSWLALGPRTADAAPPPGPVPEDRPFVGASLLRGPKTADKPLQRELALSAALAGPASPDAPCYERTWDALEDALALGWPQLPARMTAVGEAWRGARVEARCNRAACVDPDTRMGGKDNHFRPCATMSWRETLAALVDLGPVRAAVIEGLWSDGHALGEGLWTERTAVVAVDDGRLLHSVTRIHHTFTGIEREVRVDAVDACPGGLRAAGWQPPADDLAAADELARELDARQAQATPRERTPRTGR